MLIHIWLQLFLTFLLHSSISVKDQIVILTVNISDVTSQQYTKIIPCLEIFDDSEKKTISPAIWCKKNS